MQNHFTFYKSKRRIQFYYVTLISLLILTWILFVGLLISGKSVDASKVIYMFILLIACTGMFIFFIMRFRSLLAGDFQKEWIELTPNDIKFYDRGQIQAIDWKNVIWVSNESRRNKKYHVIEFSLLDPETQQTKNIEYSFSDPSNLSMKKITNIIALFAYLSIDKRIEVLPVLNEKQLKFNVKENIPDRYKRFYSVITGLTYDRFGQDKI